MNASDVVPRASASEPKWSPVVELRQYTLHRGMRDVLIDLFEREFIESQEAVGITVIGQFRDLDDPNRFVWLRGFRDMTARAQSLQAFYGGRIWKQHRDAANATMADSDDVLLLRPATARSGFSPVGSERPPRGVPRAHAGLVVAGIHSLETLPASAFIDYVGHELTRALTDSGGVVLACLVTDNSPNDFPALPVREGEDVFVWFAGFADATPLEGTNSRPRSIPDTHTGCPGRTPAHAGPAPAPDVALGADWPVGGARDRRVSRWSAMLATRPCAMRIQLMSACRSDMGRRPGQRC